MSYQTRKASIEKIFTKVFPVAKSRCWQQSQVRAHFFPLLPLASFVLQAPSKVRVAYLSLLNVVLVGRTDLLHFNQEVPENLLEILPLVSFVKEVDDEGFELDLIHVLELLLHESVDPFCNKGFVITIDWLLALRVFNGHSHVVKHLEQHV